jgi:glycosyltransferase involved in cell wall biosynthesis
MLVDIKTVKEISEDNLLVGVLTYNHERFIKDCLRGIEEQDLDKNRFSVCISDDASNDQTEQVIRDYCSSRETKFYYLRNESNRFRLGCPPISNFLCGVKSKYLIIFEGDDYWTDKAKLSSQLKCLDQNSRYVCCGHDFSSVDENNSRLGEGYPMHNPKKKHDFTKEQLLVGYGGFHSSTLMFRNVLGQLPREALRVFNYDNFFNSFLGMFGCGAYLPEIKPSAYRQHPHGLWTGQTDSNRIIENAVTWLLMSKFYQTSDAGIAKVFYGNAIKYLGANPPYKSY